MRKSLWLSCLGVSGLLFSATAAQAALLTGSLSITNGDKLFNNFTCSVTSQGSGTPTSCGSINVNAFTDSFGNLGIQFTFADNVTTLNSNTDITLGYDVAVVGSSNLISDIHMSFNGNITGSGSTNVTETVNGVIPATATIGQITVQNPPPVLDALIPLSQNVSKAHVIKDILTQVGSSAGTADISAISQTFSQTGVPEPTSVVLFGTILLGVTSILRRRAQA